MSKITDWNALVMRVGGPEPSRIPVYFFSYGHTKYEPSNYSPFAAIPDEAIITDEPTPRAITTDDGTFIIRD